MSTNLATTRQRVLYKAREIWRNGFVTYDCETTGLDWEDQIIQWAVCSQDGAILGSGYIKPTVAISQGAFEVHGISIGQLTDAPTFAEAWPKIRELLADRTVVIYNANFDISKILSSARPYKIKIPYDFMMKCECAMELFAQFYGETHEYYGTYTWQKLSTAIRELGVEVLGQAHDATHDAAATAMIIKKLAELAEQELPSGWHPPVDVECAGCQVVRECAEPDEIWYCQICGLEHGVFHPCPGCGHVVKRPASGIPCEDMCGYCQKRLRQEMMLLIGAWHWCPDHWCSYVVETPDLDEPCENCQRQREWKRQAEETERARQERIERERKEHKRAYAKAYRQEQKERIVENQRRSALGLPPLEKTKPQPPEVFFSHKGHQLQRRKDEDGKPEVYCLTCEGIWRKPPARRCAGVKVYYSWQSIPTHLKTRTQLLKLKLKPDRNQKHSAIMETAFDRYSLYDQQACVPIERKVRKKTSATVTE